MLPAKSLSAALLCLLCLMLSLRAETPKGELKRNNDENQQFDPSRELRERMTIPDEVGGKTFDEWRHDLRDGDPYTRMQAILALIAFGDKAAEVVPTLNKMVQGDGDAGVRAKVLMALKVVKINPADEEETAKTLGYTIGRDPQAVIRYEAIRTVARCRLALSKSPETRQRVVADLIRSLGDSSTCELRKACITSLIVAGKDKEKGPDPSVTNALLLRTKEYYEKSKQVRLEAIIALGAMGAPHDSRTREQVLGALRDYLGSKDKDVQIWTHVSLMALEQKIDPKGIDLILRGLKDRDREIRVHAVTALGTLAKVESLAKAANEHIKDICTLLSKEKETMVQEAACNALAYMGNKDPLVPRALIPLTELDTQKTNGVVLAACTALVQLRAADPKVMAALRAVRKHKALSEVEVRTVEGCIQTLVKENSKTGDKTDSRVQTPPDNPAHNDNDSRQTSPSQQKPIPIPESIGGKTYEEVKKDLEDKDPYIRGIAVTTLPLFREKAMEAVPDLIDLLKKNPDAGVRVKVILALKIMGINGADRENAIKALAHAIGHDSQSIVRLWAAPRPQGWFVLPQLAGRPQPFRSLGREVLPSIPGPGPDRPDPTPATIPR